jgi:hypothetical protein
MGRSLGVLAEVFFDVHQTGLNQREIYPGGCVTLNDDRRADDKYLLLLPPVKPGMDCRIDK